MSTITLYNRGSFFLERDFPTAQPQEVAIHLDSVFWGDPDGPLFVDRSILLDTNVFDYISKNPQYESIQGLVAHAKAHGLPLDPSYALIEQRLRHKDPQRLLQRYVESLSKNFHIEVPRANIDAMGVVLDEALPMLRYNIELLRDLLPLVKVIWNAKGNFTTKVDRLASAFLSQDLPRFSLGYLFAVVAFYVKHYPERFTPEVVSKIASDMGISAKPDAEHSRLWNLAFDLSLLAFCVEVSFRKATPHLLYLNSIASADRAFAVYARNIKAAAISRSTMAGVAGVRSNGQWGLVVPGADLDKEAGDYAMSRLKADPPRDAQHLAARRANLGGLSAAILGGTLPAGI